MVKDNLAEGLVTHAAFSLLCFMFADSEIEHVEPRSQANRAMGPGGEKNSKFEALPFKKPHHSPPPPLTQLHNGTHTFIHACQGQNTHMQHTTPSGVHTLRGEKGHFCIA